MRRIWCSISGHGFGHGGQTIPILNELGKHLPDVHVLLRTNLPHPFLKKNLTLPWELHPSIQDIGCVQDGPLSIDVPKTWKEYKHFQANWSQKVREEADLIRFHRPDLVISNISYFGIEAGAKAGIPTVAMGSLSWDQVLDFFTTQVSDMQRGIIHQIRQSYQNAHLMIRFAPIIPMVAFSDILDVGPIAAPRFQSTGVLRDLLRMDPEEKLVLVAFGGIPLSSYPVEKLKGFGGYRFLVDGLMASEECSHVHSTNLLPVPFRQILAESDLIITKPGYATVIEAVRNSLPVVYVRRFNFVDEQSLVDYAHRFGRARELPIEQYYRGEWLEALETVQDISLPTEIPPELGTQKAAEVLAKFL